MSPGPVSGTVGAGCYPLSAVRYPLTEAAQRVLSDADVWAKWLVGGGAWA